MNATGVLSIVGMKLAGGGGIPRKACSSATPSTTHTKSTEQGLNTDFRNKTGR